MKRMIIVILLLIGLILCNGCKRYSVADTQSRDEKYTMVGDADMTKETSESVTKATEYHSENAITGAKVSEVKIGNSVTYGGYEITVVDAKRGETNLLSLDDYTGSSIFRNFIVSEGNYGTPSYNEDGSYIRGGKQYIYVKVRVKNISASEDNKTIYFSPMIFNKEGENKYTRISGAECIGFDYYENLENTNVAHKDNLSYSFNQGEEIETTLVFRVGSASGVIQNVYMFSGFLNLSNGSGQNKLPDGSYMLQLNVIDEQYNKVK